MGRLTLLAMEINMDISGLNIGELLEAGAEAAAKGLGGKLVSDAYEKLKAKVSKGTNTSQIDDDPKTTLEAEVTQFRELLANAILKDQGKTSLKSIDAMKNITIENLKTSGLSIENVRSKTGSITIKDIE